MAHQIFLKIPGLEGEAPTKGHEKEIECTSLNFGATRDEPSGAYGGGSGSGKVNFHNVVITKYLDASSPKLFQKCCDGTHFDTGTTFTLSETGSDPAIDYLTYKLKEVTITSVNHSASDGRPMENVTLSYVEVYVEYLPQTEKGAKGAKAAGGWNIKQNAAAAG
jgi:type VI secretion system secreted protein Hcp